MEGAQKACQKWSRGIPLMVAEQDHDSGTLDCATSFCPVMSVSTTRATTRPSIDQTTSSSGKESPPWSSKLQEESDIKMFTNDPKFNLKPVTTFIRWSQLHSIKPSYVEWSEKLLTYLSVKDFQKFVPSLHAVTGQRMSPPKRF